MRKNGEVRNGKRQRRANGSGSLIKMNGIFYMRFRVRDEITGKSRKVSFSTHLPDTDLEGARLMLNEKARELGFTAESQSEVLLKAAHNAQHERERIDRERADRERAEAEAKAKVEAKERAKAEMLERDSKAISLASAFSYYVASKRRPDSGSRTLKGYESQFEIFARWMRETYPAAVRLRDVTPDMAEAFLDHLEKTRSRRTRNGYLIFLRTLWRVLRWEPDAQLTVDPWDGVRTLVQSDSIRHKDLTVDELRRVIEVIRSGDPLPAPKREGSAAGGILDVFTFNGESIRGELLLLFAIAVYSGLRLGDCATLTWGNVDLALGILKVTPKKTARRWKQTITIPIHQTLGSILASIASANGGTGYLMPTVADIYEHREPSMLVRRIQTIFRAAGLETSAEAPEGGTRARAQIGFHSLRHFFASWLDNHNQNHALTNYLTCHSQGKVESTYYHDNREALQRAISTLPSLPMLDEEQQDVALAAMSASSIIDAQSAVLETNAPQSRFEAFRALVEQMNPDELKRAATHLADRMAGKI